MVKIILPCDTGSLKNLDSYLDNHNPWGLSQDSGYKVENLARKYSGDKMVSRF